MPARTPEMRVRKVRVAAIAARGALRLVGPNMGSSFGVALAVPWAVRPCRFAGRIAAGAPPHKIPVEIDRCRNRIGCTGDDGYRTAAVRSREGKCGPAGWS